MAVFLEGEACYTSHFIYISGASHLELGLELRHLLSRDLLELAMVLLSL